MLLLVIMTLMVLYTFWQLQPARMERLGPNALIGMRSPYTVESPEAWAAAHRAAWPTARAGCLIALGSLVVAAIVIVVGPEQYHWEIGVLGIGAATILLLVFLLPAYRRADRAARQLSA